jgi:hypothetical protein
VHARRYFFAEKLEEKIGHQPNLGL